MKFLLKLIVILVLIGGGLYWSGHWKPLKKEVQKLLSGEDSTVNKMRTYYQWKEADGSTRISEIKPPEGVEYAEFQTRDNIVNMQPVNNLNSAAENMALSSTQNKKRGGSSITGSQLTAPTIGPFNAINKVKSCTELSQQIAEANRAGRDTKALVSEHQKRC